MKKNWILIALAALFLGSGFQQFMKSRELKLSGTLEMTEHSLGALTAGRLTTLTVEEGQPVNKGDLLATLSYYDQAKRDLDRLRELAKAGAVSQQALEKAELAVEDQLVRAPVDGVVLEKIRELGEVVGAGSPILIVGDRTQYWVKIFVPEGMVNRVTLGQRARLHFDGMKESLEGHVSYVWPRAEFTPRNVQTKEERVTQAFGVRISLDQPNPLLRPGVAADIDLDLRA